MTREADLDTRQKDLERWQEDLEGLQRSRGAGDGRWGTSKSVRKALFGLLLVLILILAMVTYILVLSFINIVYLGNLSVMMLRFHRRVFKNVNTSSLSKRRCTVFTLNCQLIYINSSQMKLTFYKNHM